MPEGKGTVWGHFLASVEKQNSSHVTATCKACYHSQAGIASRLKNHLARCNKFDSSIQKKSTPIRRLRTPSGLLKPIDPMIRRKCKRQRSSSGLHNPIAVNEASSGFRSPADSKPSLALEL